MNRKPIRGLYALSIGICLLFGSKSVSGQFYEIFGPELVNMCTDSFHFYAIETSAQITRTVWTILPDQTADLVASDEYSTEVVFYAPGFYTLIAFSTTVNQLLLTDTIYITVTGPTIQPQILGCYTYDAINRCYQVCAFSNTIISLPGSNGQINVTGAESYTFFPPSGVEIMWGAGGSGSVYIYDLHCPLTLCFEIFPSPLADFTTTPPSLLDTITVCKNQEIYFENESVNGLTFTWSFGDGSQMQGYHANHAYTQEGFYTVSLIASGICDCADEKQIVVEVLPAPAPTLDCVNSVCPETRQRYTVSPSGCAQYIWSVSVNGTIVYGGEPADDFIEVIWHEGPDGYIDLALSGCMTQYCSFVNRFRIPILSPDGPVTGDSSVCPGEVVTYTAPYFPGTQYNWQVGPHGSNVSTTLTNTMTVKWSDVNAPSSSFVSVRYENCFLECEGMATLPVMITPAITIQGDVQVCQDEIATIQAMAGFSMPMPVNVQWHIENASGEIMASSPGTVSGWSFQFVVPPGLYTWVATNSSPLYCNDVIRMDIEVTATPMIPLSISGETEICPGQLYGYTIESAGSYATAWTVTDGSNTFMYAGQTFQHTFGPVPPYVVEARHSDIQYTACTSDPISISLTNASALMISGPEDVCFNSIDTFSASYISGAEYTWQVIPADRGEIRRSDVHRVDVFWTQSGPVTLRLQACGVTVDKNIVVHDLPPISILGPTAACINESVTLSTSQSGMDHLWTDASDGVVGQMNSVALYPGSYAVRVTDLLGCVSAHPFQVNAFPAPVVHLSSPFDIFYCNLIPLGVAITANTDGAGYVYEWFQDDISLGIGGPVLTVTDFGTYHVAVTNQYGCNTLSERITYVNCCPPDNCGPPGMGSFPGCTFLLEDFLIDVTALHCNQHQYQSLFPGITPGQTDWVIYSVSESILDILHTDILDYTFTKPGYYHLLMLSSVTGYPYGAGQCGHYQKIIDTIPAVADFKYEGLCAGASVLFEDLTTFLPGETISTWQWDFGDPTSGAANFSPAQHPDHVYAVAGMYEVTLTITLVSGCTTVKKTTITISEGPSLSPVFDPLYCVNEAQAFLLTGNLFEILWDFGDPTSGAENTAMSDSVFHTFENPGIYNVMVSASDIHTCRSQAVLQVEIVPNLLSGSIGIVPLTPLCAGDTAILTAPSGGVSWIWSTGESTPAIEVYESNQYNVLLRDQYACTYSPPAVFVQVFPKPELIIRAREILGPDSYGPWTSSLQLCAGSEFEISGFSTGNGTWHWSNGAITQVIQFTLEGANLPGPGIHSFTLYMTDLSTGCISDTSLFVVEIFDLPNMPVIALTGGSGCSFNDNMLTVTNPQTGITYLWSDGQAGPSIKVTQQGLYHVDAINEHGCILRSSAIVILPSAQVDQIPGGCFIKCDPLEVCLPPLSQVSSYVIYQNGIPYLSGTGWPSGYQITMDGSYTIEVTSVNGCVATSSPLDVMLYTGVGSITVETWLDLDGDEMISAGDVLLPGIPVEIQSGSGVYIGATETVPGGQFVFTDYPAGGYLARIDRLLLSPQYRVIIDSLQTLISTCGDSVVVSLLLGPNCTVNGPDQQFGLCPGEIIVIGDSIWYDTGTYTMHVLSSGGCDSVFQVVITSPDSLDIIGRVWVDVDQDGMISAADTLIAGIVIVLIHTLSGMVESQFTNIDGIVQWHSPSQAYEIKIDTAFFPINFHPIIFESVISTLECGTVVVDFLIAPACPAVVLIQQEVICPGDSLWMEGQWITDPGQYSFLLSDPVTFCDTLIDLYVSLHPDPGLQADMEWTCTSLGMITLSVSGEPPFTFLWNHDPNAGTVLSGLSDGAYSVLVTDGYGCTYADTFDIASSQPLVFAVPAVYTVELGDSVWITITGDIGIPGLIFEWDPQGILSCPTCPATRAYSEQDTTITIRILDADSCLYDLLTRIMVFHDSTVVDMLYIPNVFSPNGDGINDRWTMYSRMPEAYVHDLMLFDRWGTMIFQKTAFILHTFEGWDGTLNGHAYNPGVFVYVADLTLGDGRRMRVKGDVTLIR